MKTQQDSAPPTGGRWPQPRVMELQVEEIYRHAPTATAFSYFGALLVLGVLIQTGDMGRGSAWFLWATIVAAMRAFNIVAYRRRAPGSDPERVGQAHDRLQLPRGPAMGRRSGTLLLLDEPVYRQLFTLMVITCFVGGLVAGLLLGDAARTRRCRSRRRSPPASTSSSSRTACTGSPA